MNKETLTLEGEMIEITDLKQYFNISEDDENEGE
jgi:hypothetical protein